VDGMPIPGSVVPPPTAGQTEVAVEVRLG
jgi:hypothetical protein